MKKNKISKRNYCCLNQLILYNFKDKYYYIINNINGPKLLKASRVIWLFFYALTFGRDSTDSASWMRPPVGVASGVWQPLQKTGTLECENAVVNCVHVGQRRERNSERGFGTSVFFLFMWSSCSGVGWRISQSSVDICFFKKNEIEKKKNQSFFDQHFSSQFLAVMTLLNFLSPYFEQVTKLLRSSAMNYVHVLI